MTRRIDEIKIRLANTEDPNCQYYDQGCDNDDARYLIARIEKLEEALKQCRNTFKYHMDSDFGVPSIVSGYNIARTALEEEETK